MKIYKYEAYNKDRKLERGSLQASSKNEVVSILQARNLSPVKVSEASGQNSLLTGKKITMQDVIDFTEGLTTLVEADIPIDRSLYMLRDVSKNKKMNYIVDSLRQQVKEGKGLAEAMMMYPDVFSRMYIYMIQAGEENGILPELLPRLERFLSNEEDTRNQIISALIYPVILAVVGVMSVALLLTFVVPKFAVVFEDSGADLPASTAFLLSLSALVRSYGWIFLLCPVVLFFVYRYIDNSENLRGKKDAVLLHVPILGSLLSLRDSAGFAKTMGALLNAGVPLVQALTTTKSILSNRLLRQSIEKIEKDVRGGSALGLAFASHKFFPDIMSQLITVGEESGKTADILLKLGETFDKNIKKKTDRLVGILEPVMILVLGILVGGIVVIMLSSVMSMNDIGM